MTNTATFNMKLLEETSLPCVPLRHKLFPVTGVNGKSNCYRYWIPGAMIFMTTSKLPMYSNVYVLDNDNCRMILGGLWSTLNRANIKEKVRGTYVLWISHRACYKLNVSKRLQLAVQEGSDTDGEVRLAEDSSNDEDQEAVNTLMVRVGARGGTDCCRTWWGKKAELY